MGASGGRRVAALVGSAIVAAAVMGGGSSAQEPSPSATGLLGATTEVFRDDMSEDGTWQLIEDDAGVTTYDPTHQRLVMAVTQDGINVWDDAEIPSPMPVIRVEAWTSKVGDGAAGVACGSALGVPRWLWAGLDGAGWKFGRLIDGRLSVVASGDMPFETGTDGRRATLAIECASDPAAGGDHVVVTANGVVIHETLDLPVGPYDKGTLIVAADVAPVEALFDDVVIAVGDAYLPPVDGDTAPAG